LTNELLSYIKDVIYAIGAFLAIMGWVSLTEPQMGALVLAVAALGALAIRINTIRKGGAVQTLKNKAAVAEEAGLVTSDGPPPADQLGDA